MTEQELQKLLKIKRLESPGPQYFEGFLNEFHRYQRSALLEDSQAAPSFWERVRGSLFPASFKPALALAGAAVVLLMGGVFLSPEVDPSRSITHWVESTGIASTLAQVFPGEVDAKGSPFDRDFVSARFVTGQERLLAYDTGLTF